MWPGCTKDQDIHLVDLSPEEKGGEAGTIQIRRTSLNSMRKIEGFFSFTTTSQNGEVLAMTGRTGKFLKLSINNGQVILADSSKNIIQSARTYADSRKHHIYFKRTDKVMALAIDDEDFKTKTASQGLAPLSDAAREQVEITVGGDLEACITTPYFTNSNPKSNKYNKGSLLNMRCSGRSSAKCQNKPAFNTCSILPAQSILMRAINSRFLNRILPGSLKEGNGKGRKGHRRRKFRGRKVQQKGRRKNGRKGGNRRKGFRRQNGKKQRLSDVRFRRNSRKWFSMLA